MDTTEEEEKTKQNTKHIHGYTESGPGEIPASVLIPQECTSQIYMTVMTTTDTEQDTPWGYFVQDCDWFLLSFILLCETACAFCCILLWQSNSVNVCFKFSTAMYSLKTVTECGWSLSKTCNMLIHVQTSKQNEFDITGIISFLTEIQEKKAFLQTVFA